MRTMLRLFLLPVALVLALAGCNGVDHSGPSGERSSLPLPTANMPQWSPTIEIPPPP